MIEQIYCDSTGNVTIVRQASWTVEDLGYTKSEWDALSKEEKRVAASTLTI